MLKEIGRTIISAGKVLGGLAWATPTLFSQKRRAVAIFQAQLRYDGLDEATIQELTEAYKQMGEIKNWISRPIPQKPYSPRE